MRLKDGSQSLDGPHFASTLVPEQRQQNVHGIVAAEGVTHGLRRTEPLRASGHFLRYSGVWGLGVSIDFDVPGRDGDFP